MIGKLKGIVDEICDDFIIFDVAGVGYNVYCTAALLIKLKPRDVTSLYTQVITREFASSIYGFLNKEEREWFCILQDVQGIGAKAALAILDANTVQEIIMAISAKDITAFTKAHKVGERIAKRLVTELSSKRSVKSMIKNIPSAIAKDQNGKTPSSHQVLRPEQEAHAALTALGFNKFEIIKALDSIPKDDLEAEEIIKLALQKMGNR